MRAKRSIVVAIKPDSESTGKTDSLIETACEISLLYNHAPLRLVHVLTAHSTYPCWQNSQALSYAACGPQSALSASHKLNGPRWCYPAEDALRYYLPYVGDSAAAATQKLTKIARKLQRNGINATTDALVGKFPETLLEDAQKHDARLIVARASARKAGWLHQRIWRLRRLVSRSPVPILIIPDHTFDSGIRSGMRVLLADDFSPGSDAALSILQSLAKAADGRLRVLHIRVENVAKMNASLDTIPMPWPTVDPKARLLNDHHEDLKGELQQRAATIRQLVEDAGGSYATELWHGKTDEELIRAAETFKPHLCLVGQHRTWHKLRPRNKRLGRMPLASMLSLNRPVVIAPY